MGLIQRLIQILDEMSYYLDREQLVLHLPILSKYRKVKPEGWINVRPFLIVCRPLVLELKYN